MNVIAEKDPFDIVEQAEKLGPKPYILWKPSQFLDFVEDPSSLLLGDGFLERGEWTSLGGIGGLGKSRLALQLVVCQMTNKDWCGLKTSGEPQKALFLSPENGVRRYKSDLDKIFTGLTSAERFIVDENLRIPPLLSENDFDICLGDPESVGRLQATIEVAQPGIIVFDPWADMVDGDENKSEDVRDTLRTLRRILQASAPSAAVLIVAHARTGSANILQAGDNFSAGNFMRGAKALFSKVRAEIQIAPGDKDDPNRLVMACGKSNNGPKFATRGLIFDPETASYAIDPTFNIEDWRADVNGKRSGKSLTIADIVSIVSESVKLPGDEISTRKIIEEAKEIGGTEKTTKRRIYDAVSEKYLREGSKRGLYRLGSKPLKIS